MYEVPLVYIFVGFWDGDYANQLPYGQFHGNGITVRKHL